MDTFWRSRPHTINLLQQYLSAIEASFFPQIEATQCAAAKNLLSVSLATHAPAESIEEVPELLFSGRLNVSFFCKGALCTLFAIRAEQRKPPLKYHKLSAEAAKTPE